MKKQSKKPSKATIVKGRPSPIKKRTTTSDAWQSYKADWTSNKTLGLIIFGMAILILLIAIVGLSSTGELKSFINKDVDSILKVSKGTAGGEASILRSAWETYRLASNEESSVEEAKQRMKESEKEFGEAVALLGQTGLATPIEIESLRKAFKRVQDNSVKLRKLFPRKNIQSDSLDRSSEKLTSYLLDKKYSGDDIHVVWGFTMSAKDYARRETDAALALYRVNRLKFMKRFDNDSSLDSFRADVILFADLLVKYSQEVARVKKEFNEDAEAIDKTLRVISKGGDGYEGEQEYSKRMLSGAGDSGLVSLVTLSFFLVAGLALAGFGFYILRKSASSFISSPVKPKSKETVLPVVKKVSTTSGKNKPSLLAELSAESKEQLAGIKKEISELSRKLSKVSPESITAIYLAVIKIKGSFLLVKMKNIPLLAGQLETVLSQIKAGNVKPTKAMATAVSEGLKKLARFVANPERSESASIEKEAKLLSRYL